MLNMFKFDAFSVCLSLGQSVTDVTLFTFWLKRKNLAFHRKFYKIQSICLVFLKYLLCYSFSVKCRLRIFLCLSVFKFVSLIINIILSSCDCIFVSASLTLFVHYLASMGSLPLFVLWRTDDFQDGQEESKQVHLYS